MEHYSAEQLLRLRSNVLEVRLFLVNAHGHLMDGEGRLHCLNENSRLILLDYGIDHELELDRFAFECCEAIALRGVETVRRDAVCSDFDIRVASGDEAKDNIPF